MNGAARIEAERRRQIQKEGWTPEHDAQHTNGELLYAAITYATLHDPDHKGHGGRVPVRPRRVDTFFGPDLACDWERPVWPWEPDKSPNFAKCGEIRSLEIAGALIAAEIDRRLALKEKRLHSDG